MERSAGPRAMPFVRRPQASHELATTHQGQARSTALLAARTQPDPPHLNHNNRSPVTDRAAARSGPIDGRASAASAHPDVRKKASLNYIESGTRWMEKQEVRSLREALNDMDLAEEKLVHDAAQDEASALVYKHQNPHAPYHNPEMRKDYRSHLRQGSYSQAYSNGAMHALGSRSSSSSSQNSQDNTAESKVTLAKRKSKDVLRKITPPSLRGASQRQPSGSSKGYGELADMVRKDINATRRISSGSRRTMSGSKRGFMHPSDKIWEDEQPSAQKIPTQQTPERTAPIVSAVPTYTRKNPFARVRLHHDKLERSNSAPPLGQPVKVDRTPPAVLGPIASLSEDLLPTLAAIGQGAESHETSAAQRPSLEIRSDEIRAATSKRRSDRSPNLPQPTIVSDRNDRPIVSFSRERRLQGVKVDDSMQSGRLSSEISQRPGSSASTVHRSSFNKAIPVLNLPDNDDYSPATAYSSAPTIPTICLPDEGYTTHSAPAVPQISINPPTISVQAQDDRQPVRPLPTVQQARCARPKSTPHFSPSIRQSGVLCAQCALPIAGRVLSAEGQRFHPGCFTCHQCNTNLELVAFYPEPANKRQERLERIHARRSGQYDYIAEGECEATALQREADDGDESPRFYCHLDFHEVYSPRCKSCKTPIEGEVIIACGAEWHAGHFFCAQCGDPFDSSTPFVEKEGYAWCVGCHTNRYSSKCRKCRKPVTDVVVKALGADWHSQCFCCMECNNSFDDGRYFLRGESQDPVCIRCEERRLKA